MQTDDLPLLRLSGEIDLTTARELSEPINQLVGAATHDAVIDVSDVTFMDSTGLGALVKAAERLRRQSRALILVCPPGPVLDLLEMTRLVDRFVIAGDERVAGAA